MARFLDLYAKPEESTEDLIAAYRAATAAADRTIEELDLDDTGRHHLGLTVSLRWTLLTVLMDTSRHCGHADVARELIDGTAGFQRDWPGVVDDEEHAARYLARVRGEIDTPSWFEYLRSRREA